MSHFGQLVEISYARNEPEKSFVYVRNFKTRVSWSLGFQSDVHLAVSGLTENKTSVGGKIG